MKSNIITGIDIQTDRVNVFIARLDLDGSLSPVASASERLVDCMERGVVVSPRRLSRSLAKVIKRVEDAHSIAVDNIVVSFNGRSLTGRPHVINRKIAGGSEILGDMDREALEVRIRRFHTNMFPNNKILFCDKPVYVVDDTKEISSIEGLTARKKVQIKRFVVSAFSRHVRAIQEAFDYIGITIEVGSIYPAPVVFGLHHFSREETRAGCICIDIGAETVSWCAFYDESVYSVGCIPSGLYDMGVSIAEKLGIGIREAVSVVKRKNVKNKDIENIRQDIMEQALASITSTLEKKKSQRLPFSGGITILVPDGLQDDCRKAIGGMFSSPVTYIAKQEKDSNNFQDEGAWIISRALISHYSDVHRSSEKSVKMVANSVFKYLNRHVMSPIKRQFR